MEGERGRERGEEVKMMKGERVKEQERVEGGWKERDGGRGEEVKMMTGGRE